MTAIECTADEGHPCDADDGEPCPGCVAFLAASEADARRSWEVASPQERDPKGYAQSMRDCGRGHLLAPEDR
jgi:hypothetical protein